MDYIEIKGYKSIKELHLELNSMNIFIGANGSGKTNFLSFFTLLNQMVWGKFKWYVQIMGGEDKMLHKGKKHTKQLSFKCSFGNDKNGYSATIQAGVDNFVFFDERIHYNNDEGKCISNSNFESNLKITDNYRAKYLLAYLHTIGIYHFHDTSLNSAFTHSSHIENDRYYLNYNGSNIATILYHIKEKNKLVYNLIINNIQSIAPFFLDFYLMPIENNLRLQWKDKYSDTIYGATDLSDGTLRFIALAVLFLQPTLPKTIIIDEPELGLHPFALAKVAGMMQSVTSKGLQVICATQSPELLNYFNASDIITVDNINGESKFNRLNEENLSQWLDDYTFADLWRQSIIQKAQPNS